jgi:hypothetical protein
VALGDIFFCFEPIEKKLKFRPLALFRRLLPVLRIRDILVWIRIRIREAHKHTDPTSCLYKYLDAWGLLLEPVVLIAMLRIRDPVPF